MSTDEMVGSLLSAGRDWAVSAFDFVAGEFIDQCESPIERLFAAAMLAGGFTRCTSLGDTLYRSKTESLGAVFNGPQSTTGVRILGFPTADIGCPLLCVQQDVVIGSRSVRLDFVLAGDDRCVAIELDGHDFHERTKEQAARDKSRDRLLASAGWIVVRFTGSEVYADPVRCNREALRVLHGRRIVK